MGKARSVPIIGSISAIGHLNRNIGIPKSSPGMDGDHHRDGHGTAFAHPTGHRTLNCSGLMRPQTLPIGPFIRPNKGGHQKIKMAAPEKGAAIIICQILRAIN